MRITTLAALLSALACLAADVASAQFIRSYSRRVYPYGGYGYGYGYGYGNRMTGTAFSAAEFGMAQVIASSGYRNMMNSAAAKNLVEARTIDFNNRLQWTNSYYEMRHAHRAYESDHSRLSLDELTKIAQDAGARRLDERQFSTATGKIAWPVILQDVRYVELCDRLDELYQLRAASGTIDAENYLAIGALCDQLLKLLSANIRGYSANEYETARHFIDSLRATAHSPQG